MSEEDYDDGDEPNRLVQNKIWATQSQQQRGGPEQKHAQTIAKQKKTRGVSRNKQAPPQTLSSRWCPTGTTTYNSIVPLIMPSGLYKEFNNNMRKEKSTFVQR